MPVIVNANPVAFAQASNTGIFSATTDYLRNRLDSLASLGTVSSQFLNSAWGLYDQFHGSDVMRQVRGVIQQVGTVFGVDGVRYLQTMAEFQQAPLTMQRFVMACPEAREMYLKFECDGYSDTYVNIHGNDIGVSHYDYRLVMDGALIEEGEELFFQQFFEEPMDDDPVRLSVEDKFDIRRSWEHLRAHLLMREEDPTSIYGDKF